jgi:hypothetical protein
MTEASATPSTSELSGQGHEVFLHGQTLELPIGQQLRDLEATRAEAFNGSTIVDMVLPAETADGTGVDKRVAIVDFGEEAETDGKAIMYNPFNGVELKKLGATHSRYGLISFNYTPQDRMAGFVPLPKGHSVTFGRNPNNRPGFLLGLQEGVENSSISGSHATVSVDENGRITIEDHSTNGTRVVLENPATEAAS